MSDRPAAITASLPADMSNPPFDMSNSVSGAGGGVVIVPMNELLQPPHPPTATGKYPIVVGGHFPDLGWDPALRAQVVLAEFAATDWQGQLDPGPPDDTPASLLDEITSMISPPMLLQRSRRLAEIIAQAEDATLYWTDMLMLTVSARPWTCCLIAIGQTVGQLVAMHFKYKYMRARPVQVYPAIMPPVTTPRHPSYPNSHALQGHLMSLGVATACPALRDPLMALADRVSENRVIAGLHFPSDTTTSARLAQNILPILGAGVEFQKVLAGAAAELQGLSTYPPQRSNAPA
jgi:hypothetical protein